MNELIKTLESLPKEWCWSIGTGRLGTRCCIFERKQSAPKKVITEYGELEECITKCLERYNEV